MSSLGYRYWQDCYPGASAAGARVYSWYDCAAGFSGSRADTDFIWRQYEASNAVELISKPDIDGGLIGGAALKAADFLEICKAANS